MKRLFAALAISLFPIAAFGQYVRAPDFTLQNAQGQAIAGASVYVLTQPANTSTLTPLATVYGSPSGSGATVCGTVSGQLTQPLKTDGFGHACAYAASGLYTVCYVSSQINPSPLCYQDQLFPSPGAGVPVGVAVIQGSNAAGTAFISTNEIVGSQYATPAAAVNAACAAGTNAVYFPAGTYVITTAIPVCEGIHIRCASTSFGATTGTIFQLQSGSAIWGLANPNADSSGSTPNVHNIYVDNCTWDLSQDSAALGGIYLKAISHSIFNQPSIILNNNTGPGIYEDGSNFDKSGGNYDNTIVSVNIYDKSAYATQSVGIYVTGTHAGQTSGGSNNNTHVGGSVALVNTSLKIDGGGNNSFVNIDLEDWTQYCIQGIGNGSQTAASNKIDARCESGGVTTTNTWQANTAYTTTLPGSGAILDSCVPATVERVTVAGTTGGSLPNFCALAMGATLVDGTVTWRRQFNATGSFMDSTTSENKIQIYQSGLYNYCVDQTSGIFGGGNLNTYLGPTLCGAAFTSIATTNLSSKFGASVFLVNGIIGNNSQIFPDSFTSGGGLLVHGEDWVDRLRGWCASSQTFPCTTYATLDYKGTTSGLTAFHLPDTGGVAANILVSGSNLVVTPTNPATIPSTNYSSYQFQMQNSWYDGRLIFVSYTSGITATGTIGQTCTLTGFNNGSTATATVALTGTNTIATNTTAVITAAGTGASSASPPTTATAGNGTATCSGTATVSTVVGSGLGQFFLTNSPGAGANPNQNLIWNNNGTTGTSTYFFENGNFDWFNTGSATAGANITQPTLTMIGSCWTGSAGSPCQWAFTPTVAAGSNPLNTLTLAFTGTGSGKLALPANTTHGGALFTSGAGVPAGNCNVGDLYTNQSAASASTVLYLCQPVNVWNAVTVP